MKTESKRFARNILLVHAALLLGVVAMVYFAAYAVFGKARAQVIDQVEKRQMLLAQQTARGIENYYASIFDNFELLRRTEEGTGSTTEPARLPRRGDDFAPPPPRDQARDQPRDPARDAQRPPRRNDSPTTSDVNRPQRRPIDARTMFAPALWHQLANRASQFLVFDKTTSKCVLVLPSTDTAIAEVVTSQMAEWLRDIDEPTVSPLVKIGNEDANLVCVPVVADGRRLFIAIVPLKNISSAFLNDLNAEHPSAMLTDDSGRIMAASDVTLIGKSFALDSTDSHIRKIAQQYMRDGKAGTEVFDHSYMLGDHKFDASVVSIQPIDLKGKRWWLSVASNLASVDEILSQNFRSTLLWAAFVVISITAILVSTALQMIRNRTRLERARHEILERELSQARKIQLAWLPRNDQDPEHIDLQAVNVPASHVSGDFYNWFELPDKRVCVVIGDVMGHGMAAAFLMATTQLLVRMIMPRVQKAGACLDEVNRELCQQMSEGQFVTMQIAILDWSVGKLEIATAGHPPALLGDSHGFRALPLETQLVLGVESSTEYPTEFFDLPEAASLIFYTDGVIETEGDANDRFGMERLMRCVSGKYKNAQGIADAIIASVNQFRGKRELADDLTLVTILLEKSPMGAMAAAI